MKSYRAQHRLLLPYVPSSNPPLRREGRNSRCLRDFMAAASPVPDRFTYGLIASVSSLLRYYRDADYRRCMRKAEVILAAGWPSAWVINQLRGVYVPVCPPAQLASMMLELARPTERILRVGTAPDRGASARARRLENIRCHPGNEVQGCIDFIEANAPFRFCLLTMRSPLQELIAHEVLLRGRAMGLAWCVGPV
jgi:hypothetical protein